MSNPLFAAAYDLQTFCEQQSWAFCFIGGIAVQRWGQPRFTQDVDATLLTGFGDEDAFITPLLTRYAPRLPDGREFALQTRVLLLHTSDGIPLDIALGAIPFEEHAVQRASVFRFDDPYRLRTCSAEDLLVHKAFANRPQDWLDIDGILLRQGRALRLALVWDELAPLVALKEEPEILDRLRQRCADLLPGAI